MSEYWDSRFATTEYIYGTEPNIYFKQCIDALQPGSILLPGAGEGRDAVYAAKNGWKVFAIDLSVKGREKALALAERNNVEIDYQIADAAEYTSDIQFDAIGMIYFHLPPEVRVPFHKKAIEMLKPGGTLFIEVFTPDQLVNGSFGPKDASMLYTKSLLAEDFASLGIIENEELEVVLDEGPNHQGGSNIIRFKAVKLVWAAFQGKKIQ